MGQRMSACGVLCSECPAYHASTRGPLHRERTAEAWKRIYGVDEIPAQISCGGCLSPDTEVFHTSVGCKARRCCRGKGLTSCAACAQRDCALLERAQSTWDEVPTIGARLSHADFVRYAQAYCGHRARLASLRQALGVLACVLAAAALAGGPARASGDEPAPAAAWSERAAPAGARGRVFAVRLDDLRRRLAAAPGPAQALDEGAAIALPLPDGRIEPFRAVESPLLSPALAAQHPEFRTYAAVGARDRSLRARIDLTPLGLRALVLTPAGAALVDPLVRGRTDLVTCAWARDGPAGPFECATVTPAGARAPAAAALSPPAPIGGSVRVLRYVLLGTGEYTQALGGVNQAMAEMLTSVNRLDAIFEREVAVRLDVVGLMPFPDSTTDPFPSNLQTRLLTRSVWVADSLFGDGSGLDVRQVVSYEDAPLPHGVAIVGNLCSGDDEAASAVAGPDVTANWYLLKVMAHEIGHDLGAGHTQDADCFRDPGSSWETGSGTTIMSYAGKCAPWDVEPWGDPFFHAGSVEEMLGHLAANGLCGSSEATGNTPPTVNAGPDYTIPRGTPFVLTGGGFDPDARDTLTYAWDEMDRAPTSRDPLLGPLFRSRPPTGAATRCFPALSTVLTGGTDPYEALPATDRTLHFRLTLRDNHAGTGGMAWDDVTLTVAGEPFAVTAPNGGESFATGDTIPVRWTVGGGSVAARVDILLSTDGGLHWAPLRTNTPNDGAEAVVAHVPATSGACRVQVAAVGNVFYDVSDGAFTIAHALAADPGAPPPGRLALRPAGANPAPGAVALTLELPWDARVECAVYNAAGRHVRTLAAGRRTAGRHRLVWDARDAAGHEAGAGVYLVTARARGERAGTRVVLAR